jgi:hypothetical protein
VRALLADAETFREKHKQAEARATTAEADAERAFQAGVKVNERATREQALREQAEADAARLRALLARAKGRILFSIPSPHQPTDPTLVALFAEIDAALPPSSPTGTVAQAVNAGPSPDEQFRAEYGFTDYIKRDDAPNGPPCKRTAAQADDDGGRA